MSIKVNGVKKITNLTEANTINDADVFMVETSSGSRKVTGATLKTLIADSANAAAHGVQDVIAEEFDASSSYSAGDYVYYNGKLYKFTADHATGVFDGTDADEVTVTDEMVNDVTVKGVSVVNNGVAEIPIVPPGGSIYGLVKPSNGTGLSVTSDGKLAIVKANDSQIKTGLDEYRPVVPQKQHISTFYGLAKAAGHDEKDSTESFGTYTEEAKTAIQSMLGVPSSDEVVSDVTVDGTSIVNNGVAEIPIATTQNYGVIKIGDSYSGLQKDTGGYLKINLASSSQIKTGTDMYRPIVPLRQHESTFYGLAKAAGDTTQAQSSNTVGTYTNEAKAAIQNMLGVPDADEVVNDVTVGGNSVVNNGTAEIPMLDDYNKYGLPKIGNDDSFITDSNGLLRIRSATASQVKAGTSPYRALAPVLQHASTFYGLAKAAGADMAQSSNAVGTYTDEAKTAIKSMLGVRDGDLSIGTVSTLSPDSSATASITGDYNAMELNLGIPRGKSGVYVGATAPADPDVNVWIDTSGGDDFQAIVNAVYAMLPVAEEVGF